MIKYLLVIPLAASLTACGSLVPGKPTYQTPESCEAIEEEFKAIQEYNKKARIVNDTKDGLVYGTAFAATAGLIPTGFAWLPLATGVLKQFDAPVKTRRLDNLYLTYEIRNCDGEIEWDRSTTN